MLADHAELIAATYGLGTPAAEMITAARGEQGRVWRLDTDRGTFAVKELIRRQLEAEAMADVDYQQHVIAHSNLFIPKPVLSTSGLVLAEIGGDQVRVYEWVDILPPDLSMAPSLIGATIAAIHRVRHEPARPIDWWYTDPVGATAWKRLNEQAVASGAPFADSLDSEIPILLALEALMEAPTSMQNCHRDLWADNLLPTPDGRVCIVDWENCGLEEPAHEIPMALVDFAYRDDGRVAQFWDAYVDAGGPARLTGCSSFTMVIAQFGHFWQAAIEEYSAPDATDAQRAHAIGRIAELQDKPLRIDEIDAILAVVQGGA